MERIALNDAGRVVAFLKAKWPEEEGYSHQDGPHLHDNEHEEQQEGAWSISWEGAPVEDWAIVMSMDDALRQEFPAIHFEALYGWCLGLYPGWE